MTKSNVKYHQLHDSPFYKLRSRKRLAELLWSNPVAISALIKGDHYNTWKREKSSGGLREIEAPHAPLKRVQARIANLLSRIQPPDFLTNPVKKRSYVDNAAKHVNGSEFASFDIADYFPSCTSKRVAWLFGNLLECSPDVTAILVKLVTRNGRLPQGSPASPILAYLAHSDMWALLDKLASDHNCQITVYADDITISGPRVPGELMWQVRRAVELHGFNLKEEKERRARGGVADITGVICKDGKLTVPNRQRRKAVKLKEELDAARSPSAQKRIGQRLAGLKSQRQQIELANG